MSPAEKSEIVAYSAVGGTLALGVDAARLTLIQIRRDQVDAKIATENHYETEVSGLMATAAKDDQPAAMPFLHEQLTGAKSEVQTLVAERPAFPTVHEYGFLAAFTVAGAICAAGITRYVQKLRSPKPPVQARRVA
jgi:hypothetical protein